MQRAVYFCFFFCSGASLHFLFRLSPSWKALLIFFNFFFQVLRSLAYLSPSWKAVLEEEDSGGRGSSGSGVGGLQVGDTLTR